MAVAVAAATAAAGDKAAPFSDSYHIWLDTDVVAPAWLVTQSPELCQLSVSAQRRLCPPPHRGCFLTFRNSSNQVV